MKAHSLHFVNFSLAKELVLFGVKDRTITDNTFDLFLLQAKFYLYKCKFQNVLPILASFQKLLKQYYQTLHYAAAIENSVTNFKAVWFQYEAFIGVTA